MTNRTLIGQTIGKYHLEESLGRGGMAEVYRAHQKNLDRNVAIKVMHAFLADEEGFLARFQREAKAMAALNHAHIVSVYDFDVQDGIYFIVMEFVGGGTLKQQGEGFEQDGSVTLGSALAPGEEALLMVSLVAPDEAGTYESVWAILDADGGTVGSEISFQVIVFVPATATPAVTDTPTPTATPAVVEAFGFDLSVGSCEYVDADWQCQLIISPYGGLGPYTALISDADPPSEYQGDGPFSHPILSRRCTPWVNTVTVQDDGTGQSLAESKFYDPNFFFEGGCVAAS